jgi:hypothetical protein
MGLRRLLVWVFLISSVASAQVIEFDSGGLKYLTLTHNGFTVMFAHLGERVREYAVIQVAISNGTPSARTVRPDDFRFVRSDGTAIIANTALSVVNELVEKAGRTDVIKLVHAYEVGLYGMDRFRITNGYESRRQAAQAGLFSTRIKAAAAASALVLVPTKLTPGQSTDGAVFFNTGGKPLGPGTLVIRSGGDLFEFPTQQALP